MKIIFTDAEQEILQREAIAARARWRSAGCYPRKIYEEQRAEFVQEYARGADPCSSEKQQTWLRRIKKELKNLHPQMAAEGTEKSRR